MADRTADPARIRTIALIGHAGTGKTTLAEALLHRAGAIGRLGRVEDGTATTDDDPLERERHQSVRLGIGTADHDGHRLTVLDTPGTDDFAEEVAAGLRAADLAVLVVDATAGVQAGDLAAWRTAAARGTPRAVFVNKMDRTRASYQRAVDHVRAELGDGFELVEIPIGEEAAFYGVADLITEHAFLYDTGRPVELDAVPDDLAEAEHAAHERLVEDVAMTRDDLLERVLEGEEPSPAELAAAIHDGVDAGTVFPVLCGAALATRPDGSQGPMGVDRLLDFVCRVGPAPADLPGAEVQIADDLHLVPADPAGPLLVHVVATRADEFVGQVAVLRVLSGTLHADDVLVCGRTGRKERLHGLVRVHGQTLTPIATAVAGEVCGVTKLTEVQTGDTLEEGDRGWLVVVEDPAQALHGVGLLAATPADEDRLGTAMAKLLAEDRSLRFEHDDATGQTVLWSRGDAHVDVVLDRLSRRYGVTATTEPLRIAYRETITRTVTAEGRHKKQSGGRGQLGIATVRFEPLPPGTGFEFASEVVGGAIPRSLIPAVGAGIEESMARGGPHGHPLVDVRATVLDGKHHSVDSDEMSFRMAGSLALRAALPDAGAVVLEPISHVEVTVPPDLQGEVMGDLQQRRGQVEGTRTAAAGEVVVEASVPAAELVRYGVELRALTHGRGRARIRHDRHQQVPAHLLDRIG